VPTSAKPAVEPVRCAWCRADPLMVAYHDAEWGVPSHDDRVHYEFLVLESAQSGLSWLTILRKREGYRQHFAGFDYTRVASFGEPEILAMMADPGVVRNRAKLEAAVNNARQLIALREKEGSFAKWLWGFVDGSPVDGRRQEGGPIPATSPASDKAAKELKARGFKFLGSTVMYAHMQATGLYNDHLVTCWKH
jgi:DNA-3-methyladenine glycosylase I